MTEQYNDTDADVTNDTPSDAGTFEAGPIRYDPSTDGIGLSGVIGGVQSGASFAESQEWSDLQDAATSVAYLGMIGFFYSKNPMGLLIYAGLDFLIDVIQPLDDALGYVTGNPEKMAETISQWERITTALSPLADEVRSASDDDLITWEGRGAEAAKQRLHEFADGLDGLANDTSQLAYMFTIAKGLMETAQYLVKTIIATFIEWLMWTWIPALAAAGPTFGASTAAAATATSVRLGLVVARVSRKLVKVAKILVKLRRVLYKMHPKLMRRVQTQFQRRGSNGAFLPGKMGFLQRQRIVLTGSSTYYPLYINGADALGDTARKAAENGDQQSSTDGLDPEK